MFAALKIFCWNAMALHSEAEAAAYGSGFSPGFEPTFSGEYGGNSFLTN
jgi:hypothetical protein